MTRCLLLLLLVSLPAAADEAVFFRCTDAGGQLTIQSVACPAGSEQRIHRISAPVRGPAAVENAPAAPTPDYRMPPLPQDGDEDSASVDLGAKLIVEDDGTDVWVTVSQVFRLDSSARQVLSPSEAKSYAAFRRVRRRRMVGFGDSGDCASEAMCA